MRASFDVKPEQDLLGRLLGARAAQFELSAVQPEGGRERFRISNANGRIKVEGSTPSSLLFGVNWYLKYIAHVEISTNGARLGPLPTWPLPAAAIEGETPYAFTEGMDTNPFAFDLFTEMAWRNEPVDTVEWTAAYVRRRYGAADPHALAAWKVLLNTAYGIRVNEVEFNSERDAAQESLFNAQPSLTVNRASHWSPEAMRYDAEEFKHALPEMLRVAPQLRMSETYEYDLVDIARQTLANESRLLLPRIKAAVDAKQRSEFRSLSERWLHLMDLQDELLGSSRFFLVGTWLRFVAPWASTSAEAARLNHDARSMLTTWGDRKASEGADLHDYGNKDWAGLTHDYYRVRWQKYFDSLDAELSSGISSRQIDWFGLGDAWNHDSHPYPSRPHGDTYDIAARIAGALNLDVRQP